MSGVAVVTGLVEATPTENSQLVRPGIVVDLDAFPRVEHASLCHHVEHVPTEVAVDAGQQITRGAIRAKSSR